MQKIKKPSQYLILFIFFSIFIFPQSSDLIYTPNSNVLNIFKNLRLLIIPIPILLIFTGYKIKSSNLIKYTLIFVMFILNVLINSKYEFGYIYLISCLFIFDYLVSCSIDYKIIFKIVNFSYYILLVQLIFFRGKGGRITGSYLDPNVASYFLFILLNYFISIKKPIKSMVLISFGILTFSRAFVIAVLFYFIFNLSFVSNIIDKIRLKKTTIFILTSILVVFLSYFYVMRYSNINSVSYVQGLRRFSLKGLFDESNYFRFYANKIYFDNINLFRLFLGYDRNVFLNIQEIRYSVLPHNLLISFLVKFGCITSLIYLSYLFKIFKLISNDNIGYIMGLIVYYSFLGVSSYYGLDLIIQLLLLSVVRKKRYLMIS